MPRAACILLLLLIAGCGPRGRGLADSDLTFKAPAIKQAVDTDEAAALPQLVHDLDSDDAAVRFFAIEGLRRLTGRTFDYHYYDDVPARQPAVAKWQKWLKDRDPASPGTAAKEAKP